MTDDDAAPPTSNLRYLQDFKSTTSCFLLRDPQGGVVQSTVQALALAACSWPITGDDLNRREYEACKFTTSSVVVVEV